ncbi:hypothetical protein [Sphingomonas sp. BK235]|uniref:hypothetical protein n=1 Tax=Sphingomonas sp. BK235 TaxID=2512131 RepID=UPI00104D251D|nr:hypothetical protein [Sphingomonas sp. BK235]TCP31356.1 hypothetical protein EV292_11011 [Sphingomonas sp. BK235]
MNTPKKFHKYRALSPRKAIAEYAAINGGPVLTRQIIAMGLREGTIRARASHIWTTNEASLAKAWKNEPDKETFVKPKVFLMEHDVPRKEWLKSSSWLDDIMSWDFQRGKFHITISSDPIKRLLMKDVRLHSGDVKKVLMTGVKDLTKEPLSKIQQLHSYRRLWHDIVRMTLNGRDPKSTELGTFTSADRVLNEVNNSLNYEQSVITDHSVSADEIGAALAARHPYNLSEKTAKDEIDLLRDALHLKRKYNLSRKR